MREGFLVGVRSGHHLGASARPSLAHPAWSFWTRPGPLRGRVGTRRLLALAHSSSWEPFLADGGVAIRTETHGPGVVPADARW